MKIESTRLPTFASGVIQIWKRNYLQFKKSWLINFFWIVLEPLLLLFAIGYGLGSFVSDMRGTSYIDFFFPSLLCMTSMFVSFFESTYGNFAKLHFQKIYSTMILTSLEPRQIVAGEVLWATCKGTFSALAVALIAGLFGHLETIYFLPALAGIFLSAFVFSSLGMLVTSYVKSYDGIIYPTSGLIVPMSLFSLTYFPLDHIPLALKYLVYFSPLTHSVIIVRSFLLNGIPWWQYLAHFSFLLIFGMILFRWAIARISKKLVI